MQNGNIFKLKNISRIILCFVGIIKKNSPVGIMYEALWIAGVIIVMQASIHQWSLSQFRLLIVLMIIVGATQGLVSPLISTMLEQQKVSPSVNGISASMLYVGMFVSMFFCSKLLKYIGYRKTILTGIVVMFTAILIFPFTYGVWSWSLLRFLLGVGDNITTFAVQLWIALNVASIEKGKRFSQFGLAYGVGLGLGPLGVNLEPFGFYVPFLVLGIFLIIVFFVCLADLQKDTPLLPAKEEKQWVYTQHSYKSIYVMGFLPMWSALIYGFIEVAIAGNFPVYGMKIGLSKIEISLLITTFIWGSLLFQLPLGVLGDKIGRHKLLLLVCSIGGIGMLLAPLFGNNVIGLLILLGCMGGLIGSMLSISLAFLSDLVPSSMVTRGNLLTTSHFTIGSMLGPYFGGMLMQHTLIQSLFYFLAFSLFSFVILSVIIRLSKKEKVAIHDINM
jgi:MFS family permease